MQVNSGVGAFAAEIVNENIVAVTEKPSVGAGAGAHLKRLSNAVE